VKEYYFTGRRAFLNVNVPILELTLQYGPASVLTNGTVFKDEWLTRLRPAEDASPYSWSSASPSTASAPPRNDPVRGEDVRAGDDRGSSVSRARFLPIITVARTRERRK